ncbi:MAG: trehalose-6-phosphate synthase [Acidimicrobiales bacterium]
MANQVRPLVIVSNRGPVSFRRTPDGALQARRGGGGGLVSGLAPLVAGTDTIWIASALTEDDRAGAAGGLQEVEGFRVLLVAHEPEVLRQAYDVVGNAVLWFIHHGLFELARRPRYDLQFRQAWASYAAYNQRFADAVVETAPPGAIVLVQDYHLSLLAPRVVQRRPDLSLVHFAHTPFAGPELLNLLPDPYRRELLEGLAANEACGFHTDRWRKRFVASCAEFDVPAPATFVASLAPDGEDLAAVKATPACAAWLRRFEERFDGLQLIVRVDRIELSKNIVRGFWAYEELLERWPEHRGRVCFMASIYPSREGLAEYLAYRQEVEHLVERINGRFGTADWQPIVLETSDDFPRSVALLSRYDVLLVNPVSDGMNLVAREGPQVNDRDGVLVLSTETGAWEELGDVAFGVHPCDVSATAEVLAGALALRPEDRRARAQRLVKVAASRTPVDWLQGQLDAVRER